MSLSKIVSCLDTHIRSRVAAETLATLTRADMVGIRDALVARGKPGMANQTVAYLRAALRRAEERLGGVFCACACRRARMP